MEIKQIIIHELEKEVGETNAKIKLYDDLLDVEDKRIIRLLAELNSRYKYRNENYGIFDAKKPTAFHSTFESYYKAQSDSHFIKFTQVSANDLRDRIESVAPAKGGFLIFARYKQIKDFVGVFIVRNTTGFSFSRGSKKFNIDSVEHIDFENLAMACRINVAAFKRKDIRYLSFIGKSSDDMSRYFTKWVSSANTETNAEETRKLYDLLNAVETPKDKETGKTYKREEFLDKVYHYINNSPGKTVNLSGLGERFWEDSKYLIDFAEKNDIILNGEFKANPKELRNFVEIRAKADNVEIAFPKSEFRKKVRLDNKLKDQIIITSQKLADEIRNLISN